MSILTQTIQRYQAKRQIKQIDRQIKKLYIDAGFDDISIQRLAKIVILEDKKRKIKREKLNKY